ncbi:MAG: Crp/Fnr family transcriptional regulator [Tissierellia bacterium]|nr:Crp/Fnr family transcriptional regulator [Tissierellia bacterium]
MAHEDHIRCISHVPIFDSLTDEEKVEIAHIASSRSFLKGETIYRAGDEAGTLYVLYTGKVKLYRLNVSGKEQIGRIIGPGDFMGELSLFSSLPLKDHAQAIENCIMCVLKGAQLKEIMAKYPSIAFKIMDELSRRLEKAENRVEIISLSSVNQRLAQVLLDMSQGKTLVELNVSKGDFASQLGMSQETLSRRLSAWQEEGIIEQKGHRKIIIKDQHRLEDILFED